MKTINELKNGDLVVSGGDYATVGECVHGNPYYDPFDDVSQISALGYDPQNAIEVSDFEENMTAPCCIMFSEFHAGIH